MEATNFIILVLSILSTVLVLRVALTKQNIQGSNPNLNVGSNKSTGKAVTLRRKPSSKKNSQNLGASAPLGGFLSDILSSTPASSTHITALTTGNLTAIPSIPNATGVSSRGCNS